MYLSALVSFQVWFCGRISSSISDHCLSIYLMFKGRPVLQAKCTIDV